MENSGTEGGNDIAVLITGIAVEQDSQDAEDIPDLMSYLLPSNDVLSSPSCYHFGLHYNRAIFSGWVRQPSACCGAASVAGAWNALHGFSRSDPRAASHLTILAHYESILQDKINIKQGSFERKLGAQLDTAFWTLFETGCHTCGKLFGGRKGYNITKKVAENVLKKMVCDYYKNIDENTVSDDSIPGFEVKRSSYVCFKELFESEGVNLADIGMYTVVQLSLIIFFHRRLCSWTHA